jgi:hypothetical protein
MSGKSPVTARDDQRAALKVMAGGIPEEFDLTFSHVTYYSTIVWRQGDRMGLKFKSIFDSRRDEALWIAVALLCAQ